MLTSMNIASLRTLEDLHKAVERMLSTAQLLGMKPDTIFLEDGEVYDAGFMTHQLSDGLEVGSVHVTKRDS